MEVYVGLSASFPLSDRHSLKNQRYWADIAQFEAKSQFVLDEVNVSRSHCRGLCGAAVSQKSIKVGFDIEYTDPTRSWTEILSKFTNGLDCSAYSIANLCRGWTFLEAYFKAFGTYPAPDDLIAAISSTQTNDAILVSTKYGWRWHTVLYTSFYMTIVGDAPIASPPSVLPIILSEK